MPIIREGIFISDHWHECSLGESEHHHRDCIVPFDEWIESHARYSGTGEAGLGILLGPQVCAESLQDFGPQVQLVVIEFSSASDGRGFSLAGYVRRAGFRGEMRARGPLTPEQYPHLTACGFDTVEVPQALAQRHGELSWRRCFGAYPNRYQSAAGTRASIVQQRAGDPDSRAAQGGEQLV